MADVKQVRRKFTIAVAIMLCLDLACVALLLSPIGQAARNARTNEARLWSELQAKTRETVPLNGLDGKIKDANSQIKQFYSDRFPDRFAAVPEELGKLASENGVRLSAAKYSTDETDLPGIHVIRVEAGIDGDYLKEAKFINAVERDKTFFIIDSVRLGEAQKGGVHLQIVFETYVRSQGA